jgi:hypothetical protein
MKERKDLKLLVEKIDKLDDLDPDIIDELTNQ